MTSDRNILYITKNLQFQPIIGYYGSTASADKIELEKGICGKK